MNHVPLNPLTFDDSGEPVPAVETADIGEVCPHCKRPYDGEPDPEPHSRPTFDPLAVFRLLLDGTKGQKSGKDLQVGRQVHLVAYHLGQLPEFRTLGDLAEYLGTTLPALSESAKRLPPQLRFVCALKPSNPEKKKSVQSPDSIDLS